MHALVASGVNAVVRAVSPNTIPPFSFEPIERPRIDFNAEDSLIENVLERIKIAVELDKNECYSEALAAYAAGIDGLNAIMMTITTPATRSLVIERVENYRKRIEVIKTHLALRASTRPFRYDAMAEMLQDVNLKQEAECIKKSGIDREFVYEGNRKLIVAFRLVWCHKNRYMCNALREVLRGVSDDVDVVEINGANAAGGHRLKSEFYPTILALVPGKKVMELRGVTRDDGVLLRTFLNCN